MTGFHHIALRVADFDRSMEFYTKGLGFATKLTWGEPGKRCAMIDIGDGGCIEIFEGSENLPKSTTDLGGIGGWLHFAIKTDDSEKMYNMALKAGAAVSSEPRSLVIESSPTPLPVTISFVFGPDGELLEFFQERK